ncbi:MAG TPA: alkaline phosphatase family protein [Gemmatimonadales bacterium]|nr:alkaline phosphatase family protein [Gemmatimonadales bacterium]
MKPIRIIAALLASASASSPLIAQSPVRLVVHITVDQLRPDYLVRWEHEFTGGLARLLREGVFYTAGEQDHASTETAPGHASLLSGRWPYRTGITANDRGVPDPLTRIVEVTQGGYQTAGASPRNFQGTTLHDWMRAADPDTRALSVSYKDRGAILPVGRAKVPVYWYSDGKFSTSSYYADSLPGWLRRWNGRDFITPLLGHAWPLMHPIDWYPEPDFRPAERGGRDNTFPHVMPTERDAAIRNIQYFPVFDSLTLDVALEGATALGLGRREGVDFLAVSLSITDKIGHRYGPGSLELHDQILHLDHYLGWFLDSLDAAIGLEHVALSLSADHGATDYPDSTAGRLRLTTEARELNAWALERWGIELGAIEERGLISADVSALRARGVDTDSLAAALATRVRARPGIRKVYTESTLRVDGSHDADMWRRLIPPGHDWLIAASVMPGWLITSSTTDATHGSTNLLDVRVPIIFRVPGVAAARIDRPVGVVDIGPTLAGVIGIVPTETLDGGPLHEVVETRR